MTPQDRRQVALVKWLKHRGKSTVPEVMKAFGISHRTAFRDFEALVALGIPIRSDRGVGYSLEAGDHVPSFRLTEEEVNALAEACAPQKLRPVGLKPLVKERCQVRPRRNRCLDGQPCYAGAGVAAIEYS